MNIFDPSVELTAAERIRKELNVSGGYKFAPGITIHAPSKKDADRIAGMVAGIDTSAPSESDIAIILEALLGDQYKPVMEFLESYPVEAYPALFMDLFENLLLLVPQAPNVDELVDAAESRWRRARPDLFDENGPKIGSKKK